MLESKSLPAAVFLCLAAHYVFNLSYHKKTVEFWQFVEKMAGVEKSAHVQKHTPTVSTHTSGISRIFQQLNNSVGKA